MNKLQNISVFKLLIMGTLLVFSSSCGKEDDNDPSSNNPTSGKTIILFNPNITYGILTDQDGNAYKTVKIGNQTWMAENLRTTKYNDGTEIPNVTKNYEWGRLTTGAYCTNDNTTDSNIIANYGRLYNWQAVNTGKLAPEGWHVPSADEWTILTNYLGGKSVSGGKLKETGTKHWWIPNTGATNESGFTALPGGHRASFGSYGYVGSFSYWWSTTESDTTDAWWLAMDNYFESVVILYGSKKAGHAVRCLKD